MAGSPSSYRAFGRSSARRAQDGDGAQKRQRPEAFARVVSLSKARDRCTKELSDRLAREGYAPEEVSEALERSVRCGLVDDRRFADVYARSKARRLEGPRRIERDLAERGIDASSLPGWPEEYGLGDADLYDHAMELLRRHPSSSKNPRASAYRRLMAKGYPQGVAFDVSRDWAEGL